MLEKWGQEKGFLKDDCNISTLHADGDDLADIKN